MKKVFFDYNKMLVILSVGLIVSAFVIVRGSSWPLLINNRMSRMLLLSPSNGDNTVYNIAISYVAAYIFYLFQNYIPEKYKTKRSICNTKSEMTVFVMQSLLFLEGIKNYTNRDEKGNILKVEFNTIYLVNGSGAPYKMTEHTWLAAGKQAIDSYHKIQQDREFLLSDEVLLGLLLNPYSVDKVSDFGLEIKSLVKRIYEAKKLMKRRENHLNVAISNRELDDITDRLTKLTTIYKIPKTSVRFRVENDERKIALYNSMISDVEDILDKLSN